MEENYSSTDRSAVFDRALSLPHFDEDATLLSARPVIPLNKIKVETRSKRIVIFGLTILTAILAGAISATLLMQRGQNSQRVVGSETSQPTMSSTGAAGGSTSEPAEARMPVTHVADEELQLGEIPSARDSSIKKPQTTALSHSSAKPAVSRTTKPARSGIPNYERDEDFESDERALSRVERRAERREARRQRRQRREQMDDLLRIREIFEGSPRP